MSTFLRKLFGRQRPLYAHSTDEEAHLAQFYTDSEHALQVFEQLVSATKFPKRLLVIHGLGGVGKSTLLKMYLLFCRKYHLPGALIASEEAPSPAGALAGWAEDLSHHDISLPTFQKILNQYRAIQAKVETESSQSHQTGSQLASELGKTAVKTAVGMAASTIPVVGPLVSILSDQSAEAFIDWLHGFLSKPDMDLYLDPGKRLENDFLSDLASVAARQRLVLMIDTYEQITALDEWICQLTQRLPETYCSPAM